MNYQERIPRSRGAVCGTLLILLGLWGGLAPFVGPYFHFGFTPDKAWDYNSGRLYYSIIPGAAALLGGVLIVMTRNRIVGFLGSVLGLLGGAWFVVGVDFVKDLLYRTISVGAPMVPASGSASLRYLYLERISLFAGLGVVILLAGAIAAGRFSLLAADDVADAADYPPSLAATPSSSKPDLSHTPTTVSQYPSSATEPVQATTTSPASGAPPFAPAPFPDTGPGQFPSADK